METLPPGQKRCRACGRVLSLDGFALHRYARDGRRSRCLDCERKWAPVPEGQKRCKRCERVLLAIAFQESHEGKGDGLRARCIECEEAIRKEEQAQLAADLERRLAVGRKVCGTCGKEKPFGEFWRRKDSADGYGTTCRACLRERRNAPDSEDVERVARWKRREADFGVLVEKMKKGRAQEKP